MNGDGVMDAARPCRVAICDDATQFAELLRMLFDLADGIEVVGMAADGIEAIELCRAEQPDVLLLDVAMPRMDGIEALPRVLEASPGTRVVMLTGFDSRDVERRARALGASEFLLKGVAPTKLVEVVRGQCDTIR